MGKLRRQKKIYEGKYPSPLKSLVKRQYRSKRETLFRWRVGITGAVKICSAKYYDINNRGTAR